MEPYSAESLRFAHAHETIKVKTIHALLEDQLSTLPADVVSLIERHLITPSYIGVGTHRCYGLVDPDHPNPHRFNGEAYKCSVCCTWHCKHHSCC